MTKLKKNKKNKKSRTLPKWQIALVTGLIIICPFALYFGPLFGEKIYVDQHYEKVRAVIVRIKKLPGRAASRNTYYHYNYDNHSYKGKAITNYHDNIGEVGDSIVIRCRIERPYVSYYNVGDNLSIIHE